MLAKNATARLLASLEARSAELACRRDSLGTEASELRERAAQFDEQPRDAESARLETLRQSEALQQALGELDRPSVRLPPTMPFRALMAPPSAVQGL